MKKNNEKLCDEMATDLKNEREPSLEWMNGPSKKWLTEIHVLDLLSHRPANKFTQITVVTLLHSQCGDYWGELENNKPYYVTTQDIH